MDRQLFCAQCGSPVKADHTFCQKCGAPLSASSQAAADKVESPAVDEPSDIASGLQEAPASRRKGLGKGTIAAIVIGVLVVLGIGGGAGYYFYDQNQKAVYAKEHQAYGLTVNVAAEGYDPATSSPIPLLIEGTDFEGNEVSQCCLLKDGASPVAELMRGTYQVTVTSSPVLADGTIFTTQGAAAPVEVVDPWSGEGGEGAKADPSANKVSLASLVPVDPLAVTDEQLQAAYDGLVAAGFDAASAESFRAKAAEKREAARTAKAEAEAAAERAAKREEFEQKLARARSQFDNDPRAARTMQEIALAGGDYYNNLDALMNEVYEYLKTVLPADRFEALRAEQIQWLDRRTAAMDAEMEKFNDGKGGYTGSGYAMSAYRSSAGFTMMEQRIPQLIVLIP